MVSIAQPSNDVRLVQLFGFLKLMHFINFNQLLISNRQHMYHEWCSPIQRNACMHDLSKLEDNRNRHVTLLDSRGKLSQFAENIDHTSTRTSQRDSIMLPSKKFIILITSWYFSCVYLCCVSPIVIMTNNISLHFLFIWYKPTEPLILENQHGQRSCVLHLWSAVTSAAHALHYMAIWTW